MKTNYFQDCNNLNEVKLRYKQLALKNHPDRGGDTRTMQAINLEYETIKNNPFLKFNQEKDEVQQDYIEFPDIINHIIGFKDIIIELCGNWLWISGNTYKYRKQLKQYGFLYADKKKLWYWRPADYRSANQEPKSMEYIRRKYGSDVYTPSPQMEIEDKLA